MLGSFDWSPKPTGSLRPMRPALLAILSLLLAMTAARAAGGQLVCTMDYRPVCGLKDGRLQTFSNACIAGAAKARRIRPGECRGRRR